MRDWIYIHLWVYPRNWMSGMWWEYVSSRSIHKWIARFCLWIIRMCYPAKDDKLAMLIHETGGLYQRRPQEGWAPPVSWECWKEVSK